MNVYNSTIILVILTLSFTCSFKRQDQLFQLRDSSSTGLIFNNEIDISDSMNAVTFEFIYNGGGAAVGDVNNDGMKDLFLSGNMVSSRLYLNMGDLEFNDITELSETTTTSWCTGTSKWQLGAFQKLVWAITYPTIV